MRATEHFAKGKRPDRRAGRIHDIDTPAQIDPALAHIFGEHFEDRSNRISERGGRVGAFETLEIGDRLHAVMKMKMETRHPTTPDWAGALERLSAAESQNRSAIALQMAENPTSSNKHNICYVDP